MHGLVSLLPARPDFPFLNRKTVLGLEARGDITHDELRRELSYAGVTVATSTLHRVFPRHGITQKSDRARGRLDSRCIRARVHASAP